MSSPKRTRDCWSPLQITSVLAQLEDHISITCRLKFCFMKLLSLPPTCIYVRDGVDRCHFALDANRSYQMHGYIHINIWFYLYFIYMYKITYIYILLYEVTAWKICNDKRSREKWQNGLYMAPVFLALTHRLWRIKGFTQSSKFGWALSFPNIPWGYFRMNLKNWHLHPLLLHS